MVDLKISQTTATTAPTGDDLVPLVDDPAGTPTTKHSTLTNLATALLSFRRQVIRKTADESVTSNTTPQADDALLFAIGANEVWSVRIAVFFTAATGGDLRFNVSGPSGSSGRYGFHGLAVAAGSDTSDLRATSDALGSDSAIGGAGATAVTLTIDALVANGATPGNVTFNWAQQSSSGTATVVLAGSYLVAERIA